LVQPKPDLRDATGKRRKRWIERGHFLREIRMTRNLVIHMAIVMQALSKRTQEKRKMMRSPRTISKTILAIYYGIPNSLAS
jgi:hypothetical protein